LRFLCAVGAMNCGLKVFFQFDIVRYFAQMLKIKHVEPFLYGLITLSGLYVFISLFVF